MVVETGSSFLVMTSDGKIHTVKVTSIFDAKDGLSIAVVKIHNPQGLVEPVCLIEDDQILQCS